MKKLLLLFLLKGVINSAFAATSFGVSMLDSDISLIAWQKNGVIAIFPLKTHPRIEYKNEDFRIVSDDMEIVYSAAEVRKFTLNKIDDLDDRIETLAESDEKKHFFSLEKAKPGSIITIYEINGRKLGTYTIGADGQLRYSLDKYPAGIYLIKSESTTIKIIKK